MASKFAPKGFTISELVVAITIIAIIATISFLSFSDYLTYSRDSRRVIDLQTISSSLEVQYKKNSGTYPRPADSVVVSFTGADGKASPFSYLGFVKDTMKLGFVSLPTDPTTGDPYPYGLVLNGKAFELAATLENPPEKKTASALIPSANAAGFNEDYGYVLGNYRFDPSKGYVLPHLVVLKEEAPDVKKVPRVDVAVGIQTVPDSAVSTGSGFRFVEYGGPDVPYPIHSKNVVSSASDAGVTDFSVSATGVSLTCPGCDGP